MSDTPNKRIVYGCQFCKVLQPEEHKPDCETLTLRAEVERLQKALYESYCWTGADAGDEDDFNALVNKCAAVPEAVKELRERLDACEGENDTLEKAEALAFERAEKAEAKVETAKRALREIADGDHDEFCGEHQGCPVEIAIAAIAEIEGEKK